MDIRYIIIHCSDTEEGRDFRLADIDQWHRQKGWTCVGYHFVIPIDGSLEKGRRVGSKGAHCLYYNHCSVGICYVGGRRNGQLADTRTEAQCGRLEWLVKDLLKHFPEAKVCGHRDLDDKKACPCFDVREWARTVGIPARNVLGEQ